MQIDLSREREYLRFNAFALFGLHFLPHSVAVELQLCATHERHFLNGSAVVSHFGYLRIGIVLTQKHLRQIGQFHLRRLAAAIASCHNNRQGCSCQGF